MFEKLLTLLERLVVAHEKIATAAAKDAPNTVSVGEVSPTELDAGAQKKAEAAAKRKATADKKKAAADKKAAEDADDAGDMFGPRKGTAPELTVESCRKILIEVSEEKGMDAAKAILDTFEVTKITKLIPEQFEALTAACAKALAE